MSKLHRRGLACPSRRRLIGTGCVAGVWLVSSAASPGPVRAQSRRGAPADDTAAGPETEGARRLREAVGAVVRIRMRALRDATSMELLGPDREGSGVLIDSSGLVLTIGYIVVEAASIEVTFSDGRSLPATLVGFDTPTGLALLRTASAPTVRPIELGDPAAVGASEPVLLASAAGAAVAYVASRRTFTGYWEYILEEAIFTQPPRPDFAGASLIGRDARLLGIGSLFVADAGQPKANAPGNLFVPVSALRPALGDLIANGRRSEGRPWLGLHTQELQGRLVVLRVTPGSPAQRAGLRRGDIITGIGGEEISGQADLYRRLWSSGKPGVQVALQVLQGNRMRDIAVESMDRFDHFRRASGL